LFICKKAAKRPNNYKWLRSRVGLAMRPVIHAKSALFQRDAMMNVRKMMLATAATALVVSQVNAAEVSTLPAGKPAGVKEAQGSPNALVALGVGVAVAGGLAIALASDNGGGCGSACSPAPSTTVSTAP
jgi:hypothetical protein